MARYPTLDEYSKRGNYQDGVKRCDELLQRSPNDSQLLTVKFQLLCAAGRDGTAILDQLASAQPPLNDPWYIVPIEEAMVESLKNAYPPPSTAAAGVAKLWDNAVKAATNINSKLDILDMRFSRAITDGRLLDAQQALIQLKVLQPKGRSFYMAHAAITQLLSISKDDLQSRLALSLARKAVTDRFDDDKTLDCRVPGQIFALQGSKKDLESISGRSFAESKQVSDALRVDNPLAVDIANNSTSGDPADSAPRDWLNSEVSALKETLRTLIREDSPPPLLLKFVKNATRLFHVGVTALGLSSSRGSADSCFLAISALTKLYVATNQLGYLLHSAFMAECLLRHNSYVHEARLALVYIYMRVGLGSLAISMFDSLNVKEIQHDTVGHAMLTHISQAHPFPARLSLKGILDPYERTHKALAVYNRHEDKLAETGGSVLRHGQTGMLFDLQDLRDNLRMSHVRRLLFLEHRRIARLTGKAVAKSVGNIGPKVTANWITTKDNRDFQATFDYGFNVERALYGGGDDVVGSTTTVLIRLLIDSIWSLADQRALLVNDIDVLLRECETALATGDSSTFSPSESRMAEYLSGRVALSLAKVLTNVAAEVPVSPEEIDIVITSIHKLNVDALVGTSDVVTEHLASHLIYLDLLRIVVLACRYIRNKMQPPPPGSLETLESLAKRSVSQLINHAQEQSVAVKDSHVNNELAKIEDLSEGLILFGHDAVTKFLEKVVTSAKQGWKGAASIALAK